MILLKAYPRIRKISESLHKNQTHNQAYHAPDTGKVADFAAMNTACVLQQPLQCGHSAPELWCVVQTFLPCVSNLRASNAPLMWHRSMSLTHTASPLWLVHSFGLLDI